MSETAPHAENTSLLAAQLSLLEGRRADVAELLEVGGRNGGSADQEARAYEVVGEGAHEDLVVPHSRGALEVAREEPERREREAGNLLRVVPLALGSEGRPARDAY